MYFVLNLCPDAQILVESEISRPPRLLLKFLYCVVQKLSRKFRRKLWAFPARSLYALHCNNLLAHKSNVKIQSGLPDPLFSSSISSIIFIQGDLLFNSWREIFSGNGAQFSQHPRIFSFNGRNIMLDHHWSVEIEIEINSFYKRYLECFSLFSYI